MTTSSQRAQQAIKTISQYPGQLDGAAKTVAGITLGPWVVSVNCSYGSSCCKKHASYDFRVLLSTTALQGVLKQAEQHATTFFKSFTPVHSWLESLPGFAQTFKDTTTQILGILQKIPSGQDPAPAQRQLLTAHYATLSSALSAGKTSLAAGAGGMQAFEHQQQSLDNSIQQTEHNLLATKNRDLQNLNEEIAQQPCGQRTAHAQFNAWTAANANAVAMFKSIFSTLHQDTVAAQAAVGLLLGTVADYEVQIQNIQKLVDSASGDQLSSFMTKLDVQSADALFDDLAREAQAALAAQSATLADIMTRAA